MTVCDLAKFTEVATSAFDSYFTFNFDANAQLIFSWVNKKGNIIIDDFSGVVQTIEHKQKKHRFPIVQRFKNGNWLIVEARCGPHNKNAIVLSPTFEKIDAFCVGDAIEQIIIDGNDQIWVGYFDESAEGLKRFTKSGKAVYDYNNSSGYDIFDLYAMSIDRRNTIWVYPYTDFYLGHITDDHVKIVMRKTPIDGARAIAVGGDYVAFFGSYNGNNVKLCNFKTGQNFSIGLTVVGNSVDRLEFATHGENIAVLHKNKIYSLHLHELIAAIKS